MKPRHPICRPRRTVSWLQRLLLLTMLLIVAWSTSGAVDMGETNRPAAAVVRCQIVDAVTGLPLVGATVRPEPDGSPLRTDSTGHCTIAVSGSGTIVISHVGYKTRRLQLPLSQPHDHPVRIALDLEPVSLAGMTVTPGHFAIEEDIPISSQSLRRESIQTAPQFGEDLYRAVSRLPGLASNEFSARFVVRGGEYDQVLVLLDGMELEEPFHLRDIDGGVIGIVDIASIRSIDLATGGFGARYGDRLSGVFDLNSRTIGNGRNRYETAISLTNLRASGEGSYAHDRGSWLISARHGYAEWALEFSDRGEDIKPRYWDLFAKSTYMLSPQTELAVHLLHGHDNLFFSTSRSDEATMKYDNSYAWLSLSAQPWGGLTSTSVIGFADMNHHREGFNEDTDFGQGRYLVDDRRAYRAPSLRQDLAIEVTPNLILNVGGQYRRLFADYTYHSEADRRVVDINGRPQTVYDTTDQQFDRRAEIWGAYLSPRIRLFDRFVLEAGLRFDRNSIEHDRVTSPRLGLLWQATDQTSLRAGWGRFAQFARLYDLAVAAGDLHYYPARHAEHIVLGLEHAFAADLRIRVEAYRKHLTELPPVYRNWLDPVSLFPEVGLDRIRIDRSEGHARGVECYLSHTGHGKLSWRLGYAASEVTEHITHYELGGYLVAIDSTVPGPYDQRHAVTIELAYKPNGRWQWTLAWQYHTGWPYTAAEAIATPFAVYAAPGPPMGNRYPIFHRLDIRLTRTFETRRGRISVFAEVMNLYDRKNIRAYEYDLQFVGPEMAELDRDSISFLGFTPSIGFSWRFGG